MGSAYLAINQLADAKKCFEMALSVSPGDIDAKFNLGKVQLDMGSRDAAIEIFDQILMENPLHLQALTRKGDALSSARQFQDAESCYRKALETEPSFLIAYIGYGKLLLSVAKPNEALERLKKALDIDPTCIEALMLVGKAFQMLDQTDGAAAAFRDVLSIDPSNYDAEFMLASVEGTGAPAKPDGSYVRRLFDDFADSFDDSLNQVGYDAPQQLLKMAETQLGESVGNGFDVIDLGCGTGLVGLEFKKFARNMKGIDISPRMLEEARGRGVYDELETNELLAALVRHHNDTDIVVSADVFPYIGDLESIFLAVTSALRKNGLFLFTVEAHSGDEDYRLSSKARYSHTKEYISMLAQRRGLTIVDCDDSSYRKEGGEPVSGLVVALKKSA
jgi:predicted TPR repeat methyltransferase